MSWAPRDLLEEAQREPYTSADDRWGLSPRLMESHLTPAAWTCCLFHLLPGRDCLLAWWSQLSLLQHKYTVKQSCLGKKLIHMGGLHVPAHFIWLPWIHESSIVWIWCRLGKFYGLSNFAPNHRVAGSGQANSCSTWCLFSIYQTSFFMIQVSVAFSASLGIWTGFSNFDFLSSVNI